MHWGKTYGVQLVAGVVAHLAPQCARKLGTVVAQQRMQRVQRALVLRVVRAVDVGEFAGGGYAGGGGGRWLAQVVGAAGALDERRATQHEQRGVFVALVGTVGQHELGEVVHDDVVTFLHRRMRWVAYCLISASEKKLGG